MRVSTEETESLLLEPNNHKIMLCFAPSISDHQCASLRHRQSASEQCKSPTWARSVGVNDGASKRGSKEERSNKTPMERQGGSSQRIAAATSLVEEGQSFGNDSGRLKASALSSPAFDASAELRVSPFVLPSSVSMGIEETKATDPGSPRSLYTERLQEVEEANEMLRRTSARADKENAFLRHVRRRLASVLDVGVSARLQAA